MINPSTLRAALVEALRAIPAVLAAAEDQRNVIEYREQGDWFSFIAKMKAPSIAVAYSGTQPAGRREALWSHSFSVVLKTRSGDPGELFTAIVDGMENTEIHPLYHQMELPTLQRRSIPTGETTSADFFEMTTRFISKGVQ